MKAIDLEDFDKIEQENIRQKKENEKIAKSKKWVLSAEDRAKLQKIKSKI